MPDPSLLRTLQVSLLVAVFMLPSLQASEPGAAALPLPGSGSLLLRMAHGYEVHTALETDVRMRVDGLVARVSVRQAFTNNGTDWAEGLYVFPLPDKAAVDRLRLHIGERYIEGEIRERAAARAAYEQARREGRRASLVEQERPNLFTTSVANIAPGETVVVEIEYLESLDYADGAFSLRFPLTLTPRYLPGRTLPDRQGNGWSADTTRVPDASRISPPVTSADRAGRVSLSIELDAGMPLERIVSRYHRIEVVEQGDRYEVGLQAGSAVSDHDFELSWSPAAGSEPQALLFEETFRDEQHFLVLFVPPAPATPLPTALPREMIFVIDTSGSMHGTSIAQARQALSRALERLSPGDRFNVIAFNSTTTPLFATSVEATAFNLRHAQSFVRGLQSNGGTEMRSALDRALSPPASASHFRQVVFITDGAVGNEDELFNLIENQLGSARLFTVGIGSAPNSWFMRKAAEAGRGSFTMISKQGEVGEKMDRLFAMIEQPQVTDITLHWPGGTVVDAYPAIVPDLYAGQPVSVSAKISGPLADNDVLRVTGNTPAGAFTREIRLRPDRGRPGGGVAALWARARIDVLMDIERRSGTKDATRNSIVDTALAYHLVSQHTSLVAVDKTPARSADASLRSDQLPNALPWGQDMNAIFGFPATATGAASMRTGGLLLLCLAGLLAFWPGCGLMAGKPRQPGNA